MVNIGSKCQVTSSKSLEIIMSCDMQHVTCHPLNVTHGMLNGVSKFQVPTFNSLKDYFVSRLLYNHMFYPISFDFHFVEIFNPYPNWVTFYLGFSFGQHLLWWEGLLPFALLKMPSYNPLQNALFKKGIMNKSILSSSKEGHFKRANVKRPFALSKIPLYIYWQNALIKNALLKSAL